MASLTPATLILGAVCLSTLTVRGELTRVQEEILGDLPKYDPTASKAPPGPKSAPSGARHARVRVQAQPPKPAPTTPTTPTTVSSADKPVMLPRFIVRPTNKLPPPKPASRLPRMIARPSPRDDPPEQFETDAARDQRLVGNHLTEFDRFFLNRWTPFGVTKEQRAREAEAISRSAQEMAEIAELAEFDGAGKPEGAEAKRVRESYYDIFVSRPK